MFNQPVQAVESQVVGYVQQTIEPNTWYLIGVQFQDTTSNAIDVQKLIQSTDLVPGVDYSDASCPSLKLWKYVNGDWQYVPLLYAAKDSWGTPIEGGAAWVDAVGGDPVKDITVASGESVWLFTTQAEAAHISVAGQVVAGGTSEFTLNAKLWNLLANPYPVELAINGAKFKCNGLTPGNDYSDTTCPSLKAYAFVNGDWQYVPYLYAAYDSWGFPIEGGAGWVDAVGGDPTEDTIKVGGGFWMYYTNSDENIKITIDK